MTRTLYLMRHAQAGMSATSDFDRELTETGHIQAQAVGRRLHDAGIQAALVSAAVRTRQTFADLHLPPTKGSDMQVENVHVEYMKALYDADEQTLLQRICEVPDDVTSLLVLAHAPGIPSLAAKFTWETSHRTADLLQCNFPPATILGFRISTSWADLAHFGQFTSDGSAPHLVRPIQI